MVEPYCHRDFSDNTTQITGSVSSNSSDPPVATIGPAQDSGVAGVTVIETSAAFETDWQNRSARVAWLLAPVLDHRTTTITATMNSVSGSTTLTVAK